jgi:RNA polymerase sigma factor (TIGR02999 family)
MTRRSCGGSTGDDTKPQLPERRQPADHGGAVGEELEALIRRADQADREAADKLFTILYSELHRLAEHSLRRPGSALTLGATTLLHEAYLNIAGRENVAFADRSRFLAYASRAMRGLVIDYVRARRAQKRGHQFEITLTTEEPSSGQAMERAAELERLGDALDELAELEPALAELVDLHFFCGFSFAEIAELRGVSERTVQRDWRKARMLLHHALLHDDAAAPDETV